MSLTIDRNTPAAFRFTAIQRAMLTRRLLLTSAIALATCATLSSFSTPAAAQSTDAASAFIEQTSRELTNVVNGNLPTEQKKAALAKIIGRDVDVAAVAQFCLGRFWRSASPQQQQEYVELFHRVLVLNITGKVGDYQGVSIKLGRSSPREGDIAVTTTVIRPGNEPSRVDWLVSTASGSPKIIDVIAEGTSLRLTQRSDYASYLSHNGNDVNKLIAAMRQQAGNQPG
jgi:phospholipid transport system substrate-binding protein